MSSTGLYSEWNKNKHLGDDQETIMVLKCPACTEPLRMEQYNGSSICSGCSAPIQSVAFPALARVGEVVRPEQVSDEGEASCFYHPEKQAIVSCAHCGRFLCALCDLEVTRQHLCPACLSQGKDRHGVSRKNKGYLRYDMVALALAFWPLLLFAPLFVLGAPLALYVTIKYYKRPVSIVPVGRWRFWLASLLAVGQLTGGGLLAYYMLT